MLRPITVSRGDKLISLYPSDFFKVTYSISFDHPLRPVIRRERPHGRRRPTEALHPSPDQSHAAAGERDTVSRPAWLVYAWAPAMLTTPDLAARQVPVIRDVDVLVVGGGTAGAVAGIAAAREGARTLIVEQFGWLGGSQTGALVTPMMPNQLDGVPLNAGIDAEICDRLIARRDSGVWRDGNRGWFNPESLKHVLEQMALDAGAELLYYTFVDEAVVDSGSLCGVVLTNKAGRAAVRAGRTVDATGDADVAARAGVPYESGDPATGLNQPFSVRFHLGNVSLERFADFLRSLGRHDVMASAEGSDIMLIHTAMVWGKGWPLEPLFRQAVADGVLHETDGDYFQVFSMAGRPGELACNCPRIRTDIDGTNPFHLTRAQITGREIMQRYVAFCRQYLPGCEHAYLAFSAPMVGVRESRRIRGEYYLTVEDVLEGRKFDDAVCRNNYPIDIHRDPTDEKPSLTTLPPGAYHEVPYRCLVPLGVDDLLVAGRCLSASFEAQSSVRIQPDCRALGQAAGLAAALSLGQGITPRALDGRALREALRARGASL